MVKVRRHNPPLLRFTPAARTRLNELVLFSIAQSQEQTDERLQREWLNFPTVVTQTTLSLVALGSLMCDIPIPRQISLTYLEAAVRLVQRNFAAGRYRVSLEDLLERA